LHFFIFGVYHLLKNLLFVIYGCDSKLSHWESRVLGLGLLIGICALSLVNKNWCYVERAWFFQIRSVLIFKSTVH